MASVSWFVIASSSDMFAIRIPSDDHPPFPSVPVKPTHSHITNYSPCIVLLPISQYMKG